MRHVRYEPEAADELDAAVRWYESEREGLGLSLFEEVVQTVSSLRMGETVSVPVPELDDQSVRRVLLSRFPYAVLFVEHGDEVRIVAVAHTRRRPEYWRGRGPK